jgi:cleavage stimulation factor subunit 2
MANLHFELSEDDLKSLFTQNGLNPVKLHLLKDPASGRMKGSGFCEFQTSREAAYAVNTLSGYEFKGRSVRFEFAKAPT